MASSQERPTLSKERTTQYFDRLEIPEEKRIYDVAGLKPEETYQYLALLQKHHLVEIPFENLTLHYSRHRQISLDVDDLFKKIIGDQNGRGGYCMENNGLFAVLLRTIGFKLFTAGARVFDDGVWIGWSHMVINVTIGDNRYHIDVGFGSGGPIQPMKLDPSGTVFEHIKPATCRLRWGNIEANTDPDQRLWIWEHRIHEGAEFRPTYSFTELEYLPRDYILMNYWTSTKPGTFFTTNVVGEKKIMGDNGDIVGGLTLLNTAMTRRIQGEKEMELKFESELDRVRAVEERFGIKLGQEERDGIVGLSSEIK